MLRQNVRNVRGFITRRCAHTSLLLLGFLAVVPQSRAQVALGPVTLGAGMRTSYTHTDVDKGTSSDRFLLDSARLYVNGPVTDKIKFMFNTEYNGSTNDIRVLDAVARIELDRKFNIWAGRFLEPSDRANLYGPYYAHHWGVYTDAIQNGHPAVFQGRDNGVAYWGDFGSKTKVKVSAGAFDGRSADGNPDVIGAARIQIDFWDAEDGYYLNSTYYGDKNLLAIGGATQVQSGNTANTVDFLLERKVLSSGAYSIEAEYANYNGLGGYLPGANKSQGAFVLGSFLFPKAVGMGKFEILGKFAKAASHGQRTYVTQKTTEVNFNYLIKQFNARVMTFYKDTRFNRLNPNYWQAGIGLQFQM